MAELTVLDSGQLLEYLRVVLGATLSSTASILSVSAILGRYICTKVFEAPFRRIRPLLSVAERDGVLPLSDEYCPDICGDSVLKDVYQKLSDVNETRAQLWRSDMMSTLDPTLVDNGLSNKTRTREAAAERRTEAAYELTEAF
ncbi:uncharacterized protein LY89DRAFT_753772 [Mollisia scopiformis]|uniref:Uncharacterized protein n=1 Tax=Mollisia scopiformis TaxID=149040 RepID=A0A194WZS9_MOLSC|nr:uncharacterized protein LY89DRAFT_753772 [Mollisia scopiformis]KUJ13214.1 hypothetical protein LY89DRAFT_753772 [Mollisia scopiformis]